MGGDDLHRHAEVQGAERQIVTTLRHQNESLQERLADLLEQVAVLTEERDTAHVREEEQFEQMIALEEVMYTTESYLTEKLVEKEEEVGRLSHGASMFKSEAEALHRSRSSSKSSSVSCSCEDSFG